MLRLGGLVGGVMVMVACHKAPAADRVGAPIARWSTGSVSKAEVDQYAKQLPPALQQQLNTDTGYRSFIVSVVDKKLLAEEAKRRGLAENPDIRRQVEELEQRLEIQLLLSAVEAEKGPPSDTEMRAYYEAHKVDLHVPAQARLGRLFVRENTAKSKARLASLLGRLKKEPFEHVASAGDGPERLSNGDIGWVSSGDSVEAAAGLALKKPGDVSPVIESEQGLAVIVLRERRESRLPSFDELKASLPGRMAPHRQRQSFDSLISSLRSAAKVEIVSAP